MSSEHCGFCKPGTMEACQAPAFEEVRAIMFGSVSFIPACKSHWDGMPAVVKPLSGANAPMKPTSREDLKAFFKVAKSEDIYCRGCGEIVEHSVDGEAGPLKEISGELSALVLIDHLERCSWRRTSDDTSAPAPAIRLTRERRQRLATVRDGLCCSFCPASYGEKEQAEPGFHPYHTTECKEITDILGEEQKNRRNG